MWWVPTTRGCCASGDDHEVEPVPGSPGYTSRPARSPRDSSASRSAASSTTFPRDVFSRIAPSRIIPSTRASNIDSVSGAAGTCTETTSDAATSSSSESTSSMPMAWIRSSASSSRSFRIARTVIPNARARSATANPISPSPTMPDDLPEHAVRLPVRGLVPRAGAQIRDVVGDPPVDRQQEPHRELGDGDRVATRDVRHVDPDLGRGLDVDRVGTRSGSHDQLQRVRRLDGRGCHLRAPNDQRLEPPDAARELVAREGGFRDALVPEIGQGDRGRRVDGIGEENAHPP